MAKDSKGHGSNTKSTKIAKSDTRIVKRMDRLNAWDNRAAAKGMGSGGRGPSKYK